eukprot:CAMPEP_0113853248 /NCGR_PEP_ID=MMETSP0372-20130328/6212_1 /TAXON_ID=340204 /ORGANISM="Lankesteria abbotti" /LENGTH=487 /DNA_ID=CAMNT_0000825391 /DNA_START=708 /DNA_END=2169 /DNA_ORIENTATION=- /assembly_acc=CAM_ASM_000359
MFEPDDMEPIVDDSDGSSQALVAVEALKQEQENTIAAQSATIFLKEVMGWLVKLVAVFVVVAVLVRGDDNCSCDECVHEASTLKSKVDALKVEVEKLTRDVVVAAEAKVKAVNEAQVQETRATEALKAVEAARVEAANATRQTKDLQATVDAAQAKQSSSCEAVEKERDSLMSSRLEIGSNLEVSRKENESLSSRNKELSDHVARLNKSTEALVAVEALKQEQENTIAAQSATIAGLEKRVTDIQANMDNTIRILKSSQSDLEVTHTRLSSLQNEHDTLKNELSSKTVLEYLSSVPQQKAQLMSLWTFLRSLVCHAGSETYTLVTTFIPPEFQSRISSLWQEKVVTTFASARPKADVLVRKLTEHPMTEMSVELYSTHMSSYIAKGCDTTDSFLKNAAIQAEIYLSILNNKIDKFFIEPLTSAHPKVEKLIPPGFADRIALLVAVRYITWHLSRSLCWFVTHVLPLVVYLAVPCCWGKVCRRRQKLP